MLVDSQDDEKGSCTVPLTAEGISLPSSPPDKDPWRQIPIAIKEG
ncbi:hypothetical protein HanIR_Chr17g0864841 [Helianthus annuus]|nr:hypothetical protein HanIR_Chr17g0864841 [Helianthus annuus]